MYPPLTIVRPLSYILTANLYSKPLWKLHVGLLKAALPVAAETYLLKELHIETIIRNPEKGRSFRLQVYLA